MARNLNRTTVIGPATKGLSSGGVDVSTPGESIALTSSDGSVLITPNAVEGSIDLKANGASGPFVFDKVTGSKVAGASLSALKAVRASSGTAVVYATQASTYESAVVLGVTTNSAAIGAPVNVMVLGQINDPSFAWPANTLLFLGTSGAITSTAPTSGYLVRIGKALGAGSIMVEMSEPIFLG